MRISVICCWSLSGKVVTHRPSERRLLLPTEKTDGVILVESRYIITGLFQMQ